MDVGAAFLTVKPWGIGKTVAGMVGLHLLGRLGDNVVKSSL
jgi:hypothetical protein